MPKISVESLIPGMKLTKPVIRGSMVLLSAGTELTENWIQKIKDMDLDRVFVEGKSGPDVPKDALLLQLDIRFKKVEDEPYMNLLKKAVTEHIEGLYENNER